ncbi:MAG: hypothetical protein J7575_01825 [Chloroflexi bacterium]|nr:hypothetical protein [Chloroflexota bacterium]
MRSMVETAIVLAVQVIILVHVIRSALLWHLVQVLAAVLTIARALRSE